MSYDLDRLIGSVVLLIDIVEVNFEMLRPSLSAIGRHGLAIACSHADEEEFIGRLVVMMDDVRTVLAGAQAHLCEDVVCVSVPRSIVCRLLDFQNPQDSIAFVDLLESLFIHGQGVHVGHIETTFRELVSPLR